jgi:hypothetical protein
MLHLRHTFPRVEGQADSAPKPGSLDSRHRLGNIDIKPASSSQ